LRVDAHIVAARLPFGTRLPAARAAGALPALAGLTRTALLAALAAVGRISLRVDALTVAEGLVGRTLAGSALAGLTAGALGAATAAVVVVVLGVDALTVAIGLTARAALAVGARVAAAALIIPLARCRVAAVAGNALPIA
jgi:hypothetical protein